MSATVTSARNAATRQNVGVIVAGVIWLLFVANFTLLHLSGGDAPIQYHWVQRLYGDRGHAIGYYFGLGLLEAPFYGAGKLFEQVGIHTFGGSSIEEAFVAIGTGLFVIPAAVLLVILLRDLDLPGAALALLAATFGTSLVWWVVFSPGKDHPADVAFFTLVMFLTYRYFSASEPTPWIPWALGAAIGFSITVRYFAGAEAIALFVVLLAYSRWRDAARLTIAATATFGVLLLIPWALGTPLFGGGYSPSGHVGFFPLNPLRMLFTDHRGLFIWSPVTVLATLGLILLFRRRPECRSFLVAAYAMGASIILSYALIPFWDGAWSFSQRYYTPLFPLVVLGIAGLIEATRGVARGVVVAAVVLATAWSLVLCFNLAVIGEGKYTGPTVPDGAWGIALLPVRAHTSGGEYAWAVYDKSRLVKHVVPWPFAHPQAG